MMQLTTARLSGHQSFPFRNTWLTKGVVACAENPSAFREADALVKFGVGKNMVESIRYWSFATQVLEIDPTISNNRGYSLRPTEIARNLFIERGGWDPYLEDKATLWLLHYLLVTNWEQATTAYYAFNVMTGLEFTRSGLEQAIGDLAATIPQLRASRETVRRDVGVFLQTYAGSRYQPGASIEDSFDCPLAELGLIFKDANEASYAFARGPKASLPDEVVLYALCRYAEHKTHQRTFTFDELAYQPFGPGRVFKLDETSLVDRIERLSAMTAGALQMTDTAGYRQVLLAADIDPIRFVGQYFQTHWGETSYGRA